MALRYDMVGDTRHWGRALDSEYACGQAIGESLLKRSVDTTAPRPGRWSLSGPRESLCEENV
jgi:hypothetical protein